MQEGFESLQMSEPAVFFILNSVSVKKKRGKNPKRTGNPPPKNQKYICFLLPVVLFFDLNCFGGSCRVLEMSACPLLNITELDGTLCAQIAQIIHLKNSTGMC